MVYESDFYTTRRPYRSSYNVTTPRHYVVVDHEPATRRADQQYSYSYTSTSERSAGGPPQRSSYSSTLERRSGDGPGGYSSYSSERSSSLGGPAGYRSSYSSTSSGRLPHGTTYRHYSYRV